MRVFSRRYIIGTIAALLLLPTVSLLAYTPYTAEISTQDISAGARAYYPVLLPLNIAGAISLGMLDADGLYSSLEDGATPVKYLLTGDKVAYVTPALDAGESVLYTLTLGESSPQTSFPIIVGDGGYITTADNAALEPGDNFELIYDGYVDTSAGSDKYLVEKGSDLSLYVSDEGEITADVVVSLGYPELVGTTSDNITYANVTSISMDLPDGSAGDYLVAILSSVYDTDITWPAGWVPLFEESRFAGAYYVDTDGTGGSVTVTSSPGSHQAYIVSRIDGASDIEIGTMASSNDPPSLTASWGIARNLWMAITAQVYTGDGPSTYPSGYTDGFVVNKMARAFREYTAATEDPGAFNKGTFSNTLVFKPESSSFSLTASGINSGEHEVKLLADGTNLKLYIDGVLEDSVALGVGSVIDNAADWVLMQNNVSPYIDYISYSVSGTPQFTYEPTSLVSGTTLVDEVNSFDGTITWGTNDDLTLSSTGFKSTGVYEPGGGSSGTLPVVIEAPTTAPDMFIDPTAAMTNTLPYQDLVNPAATSLDWSSRTLYTILAIIVAIGLSVGVTIATGSLLLGASAAGIILLVGWNMSIISFWVVLAYAIMVLTYLVTVRSM